MSVTFNLTTTNRGLDTNNGRGESNSGRSTIITRALDGGMRALALVLVAGVVTNCAALGIDSTDTAKACAMAKWSSAACDAMGRGELPPVMTQEAEAELVQAMVPTRAARPK